MRGKSGTTFKLSLPASKDAVAKSGMKLVKS
jgi:hypothetical protein